MTDHIYLARQPIFDRDRLTFGYELLYRSGITDHVQFDDPDEATRCVIERALLDWGMERIIGDRFGLINASPQLIVAGLHRALPPEGIIIELREEEPLDDATFEALVVARREGYHFALDNITEPDRLAASTLLEMVSMVKVECSGMSDFDLARVVAEVRSRRPAALLVAEKIESVEAYKRASSAGFDLFQGYYFARTEVLSRAARPSSMASTLALVEGVQRLDIDVDSVERIVGSDPTLTFRVLAVVNSIAFGLDRRVESLRQAIGLLGIPRVRHLAQLLALSTSTEASAGLDLELIRLGVVRANFASAIASSVEARSSAFTVGLLSVTDSLFGTPMAELLSEIPVTQPIEAALVEGAGELGWILKVSKACEDGDIDALRDLAPDRLEELQVAFAAAEADLGRSRPQSVDVPV